MFVERAFVFVSLRIGISYKEIKALDLLRSRAFSLLR